MRALNVVGLERRGLPTESIAALRRAFRLLWSSPLRFDDALAKLDRTDQTVARLATWLESPDRRVHPAKRLRR